MLKGRKVQGWGLRTKLREVIRNKKKDWRHYRPPQVYSNCLKTIRLVHILSVAWKRRQILQIIGCGSVDLKCLGWSEMVKFELQTEKGAKWGERRKESRGWVKQRGKGTEGKGRENSQTHSSHSPIRSKSDYAAFKRDSDRASKIERVERYRRN